MPEDSSLRDFVLGYCQQVGGLVEPPAYGIDEVLLPEEVAARWGVDPFQRFRFSLEPNTTHPDEGVTSLYYGHPLVETIVTELRQQPANSLFFINPLRVEKPGLRELAGKLSFANARPTPGSTQRTRLYHYACFNFKTSLVSDEKRELVVPVWMHLQGGYRLPAGEILAKASLEPETAFPNLDAAPPTWRTIKAKEAVLSTETLAALLERARLAVLDEIAPILETAQKRSQHFLELDQARLNDYYDDLQRDLEKRLARAEAERRPGLEAKLEALRIERQSKLIDAEQKYRLRIDLELINLAIIAQPKIEIEVAVGKREVTSKRLLAWDPVRHIIEPLVCDVCGQPGEGLSLCESGHLAHATCLAPQCVDCKRTFCQLCGDKVHTCVVCDAPVCIHSQVLCKTCGRVTCQKHANLCHAADGQPQKISAVAPAVPGPLPPKVEPARPEAARKTGKARPPAPKKPLRAARPANQPKIPTVQRVQVDMENSTAEVTAYALHREHEIAVRSWKLTPDGIACICRCEKGWECPANNLIYRPADVNGIDAQLLRLIRDFANEYGVPEKKISFFRVVGGQGYESLHFSLPAVWKDPEKLALALKGFLALPR